MVANCIIYLLLHEAYIEIAKEHPTMIFNGNEWDLLTRRSRRIVQAQSQNPVILYK